MKIYLISRPAIDERALAAFLNDEGQDWKRTPHSTDAEDIAEIAGRICHMSFGCKQVSTSNRDFAENLIAKQHESVLEHATWTFIATGITRSLTHQIVRHRIGFSYSQMSQQFNDQTGLKFLLPPGFEGDENIKSELEKVERSSRDAYSNIKKSIESYHSITSAEDAKRNRDVMKLMRTAARAVLPNCIETKLVFSANARSLRHFLKLRGSLVWDIEMRLFCNELLSIMKQEASNLFRDFITYQHEDGYPIVFQKRNP
jgi:thymidylate synthase (FAD)